MFPISLVAHNDKWAADYKEMESMLAVLLSGHLIDKISHIGSTAIQGIWAKNIVDVMVEMPASADMEGVAQVLEQNGFLRMCTAQK